MKNKELQEKRMKDYFIQAAKGMLKGEGLKSLSVRSIADQAGYSFATMYNYFKDVNELVFHCVNDFQEECKVFTTDQAKKSPRGISKVKTLVLAYVNYFVEYPGIFELFYLERVANFGNKQTIINVISTSLDSICEDEWNYCISKKLVKAESVDLIKAQLRFTVLGMLLLYMNRRVPSSYAEFISQAEVQVDALLAPLRD